MEATKSGDLKKIKIYMINRLGGFDEVDQTVSLALRVWVGKTAMGLSEYFSPSGTIKHANFLLNLGNLFTYIGMHEQDLRVAERSRKIFEELNDEQGSQFAMTGAANALFKLGRNDEALELRNELIELTIKKYGEIHIDTLIERCNLGESYMNMKLWSQAEDQFTAALKGFNELKINDKILCTQRQLARVLRDSGKDIGHAEKLFKHVLDGDRKAFGPDEPAVLVTEVDHSRCLALKGKHRQALISYRKALPVLLKTYGENWLVKELRVWINEAEQSLQEMKE